MRLGRAVVTGVHGALGAATAAALHARGVEVVGVDVRPDPPPGCARYFAADITALDWRSVLDGADAVFHLAAFVHRAPTRDEIPLVYAVNHHATRRLAGAARLAGCKLVFVSTVAVLGPGAAGVGDDAPVAPATEYGKSKALAEADIAAEGRAGLRAAVLRMPLLYGPRGRGNMERMLSAIARGRYWPIGDPATRKSCLHFDDAADALLRAATHDLEPSPYVVAPPEPVSLGALHAAAYEAVGARAPRLAIPTAPARIAARAVDVAARAVGKRTRLADQIATLVTPAWYDGSRFVAATGFAPTIEVAAGLRATATWMDGAGVLRRRPVA